LANHSRRQLPQRQVFPSPGKLRKFNGFPLGFQCVTSQSFQGIGATMAWQLVGGIWIMIERKVGRKVVGGLGLGWMAGLGLGSAGAIALPAQIIPDGTQSTQVMVSPAADTGDRWRIQGGDRAGGNLFHSFREFSIPTGSVAEFENAPDVVRILGRVTGGRLSNIDGTIRAAGGADLFLINPAGFVFGPHAELAIGGAFLASTAEAIAFADGSSFSAVAPEVAPVLTMTVPVGLQLGQTPGAILNQAQRLDVDQNPLGLEVLPGRSLALVGGEVWFAGGGVNAPGGDLTLTGLAAAGTVGLSQPTPGAIALTLPPAVPRANITLDGGRAAVRGTGGGTLTVIGDRVRLLNGGRLIAGTTGPGAAGDLRVTARSLDLMGTQPNRTIASALNNSSLGETSGAAGSVIVTAGQVVADQAVIFSATEGTGRAGSVRLQVETLAARDSTIATASFGAGDTGDVLIQGQRVQFTGGSEVGTLGLGSGRVGDVQVVASEGLTVQGRSPSGETPSRITTSSEGSGAAGRVILRSPVVEIRAGALVIANTLGTGSVGGITIEAPQRLTVSGFGLHPQLAPEVGGLRFGSSITTSTGFSLDAPANVNGNTGDIAIATGHLTLADGGTISSLTNRAGRAGDITVQADTVEAIGATNPGGPYSQASGLSVNTFRQGQAGTMTIAANRVTLRDGAQIAATGSGSGDAGAIAIRAQTVEVIGTTPGGLPASAIAADTLGLELADFLDRSSAAPAPVLSPTLGNDPRLVDSVPREPATGRGGNIRIEADRLVARDGGIISASTGGSGAAGTITVMAREVLFQGTGPISADSIDRSGLFAGTVGSGDGGQITVDADRLTIQDGAQISSSSVSLVSDRDPTQRLETGRGGDVAVRAGAITLAGVSAVRPDQGSQIASNVQGPASGDGGNLSLITDNLTLEQGGIISASTLGSGNAGSVQIQAQRVTATGRSPLGGLPSRVIALATTSSTGNGGTVAIAADQLTLSREAAIVVSSAGSGNPGNVQLTTDALELRDRALIGAVSRTGRGGNIQVRSRQIQLRDRSFMIATGNETGDATTDGNIDLTTRTLVLLNRSGVITSASNPAGGSNIRIQGPAEPTSNPEAASVAIFQSPDSVINAAGTLTIGNQVVVSPPDLPDLVPVDYSDAIAVAPCDRGQSAYALIPTGRGGLPLSPTEAAADGAIAIAPIAPAAAPLTPLPSPQSHHPAFPSELAASPPPTVLLEATQWQRDAAGTLQLVATAGGERSPQSLPTCLP
jgi:filamentous hemagglutinin family protein